MKRPQITYKSFGEEAILIAWPEPVSTSNLTDMRCLAECILNSNIRGFRDLNYCYNSMVLIFDKHETAMQSVITAVSNLHKNLDKNYEFETRLWEIPVCYDLEFGIDLEELSKAKSTPVSNIIAQHTKPEYVVYGIGFLPGFLYLGGLNEVLYYPRKKNPRIEVARGSVGIGGTQTGVYPMSSPGGWNIIGRTPLNLFDIQQKEPTIIKPGDSVKFKSIDLLTYRAFQQGENRIPILIKH